MDMVACEKLMKGYFEVVPLGVFMFGFFVLVLNSLRIEEGGRKNAVFSCFLLTTIFVIMSCTVFYQQYQYDDCFTDSERSILRIENILLCGYFVALYIATYFIAQRKLRVLPRKRKIRLAK